MYYYAIIEINNITYK